jgi:hypothetical protein
LIGEGLAVTGAPRLRKPLDDVSLKSCAEESPETDIGIQQWR